MGATPLVPSPPRFPVRNAVLHEGPEGCWAVDVSPDEAPDDFTTLRLLSGGAGDHAAVYQWYNSVFQGASREAFFASLDDPFYEPTDRLIVRRGPRVLAHVHATKRVMNLGTLKIPVSGLFALGTLPEFRHRGFARLLLNEAECAIRHDQSMLGLLTTKIPHFFRPADWAVCGRHSHARASTRDLLSWLSARGIPPADEPLNIRPLRQVELPRLMRVYAANTQGTHGSYERTEAYWRWLVSRQGYDQICVALDGPEKFNLDNFDSPIVGYVITREDRIIELMGTPGRPEVAEQLLARACSEAIERDYHSIQLHDAPDSPLYELFHLAGGTRYQHEAHQGEVFMVKLLDPVGFLKQLRSELFERAEAAGLSRPCELGLSVEGEKYLVQVTRRSCKLARNKLGRSYLRCNRAEFTRLVLGHLDLDEAIEQGRLEASTRLATEMARVLFPRLPLWRSPWDDMLV